VDQLDQNGLTYLHHQELIKHNMGYKTISQNRVSTKTAESTALTVLANTGGNGYVISGATTSLAGAGLYETTSTVNTQQVLIPIAYGGLALAPVITNIQFLSNTGTILATTNAASTLGGNILVTGLNFVPNVQVWVNNTNRATTTYISSTKLIAKLPANTTGISSVIVASAPPPAPVSTSVQFYPAPIWQNSNNNLYFTENNTTSNIPLTVSTTTGDTIIFANTTLPIGLLLQPNITNFGNGTFQGYISGTITGYSGGTGGYSNVSFTVSATNSRYQATSSSFTANIASSYVANYLVVGGGGGGGSGAYNGGNGGGGAGGFLAGNVTINRLSSFTVTVGNGGAVQYSGGNSSITGTGVSITAIGGGAGGPNVYGGAGATGGSGGGSQGNGSGGNYGQGTAGQGNRGGAGDSIPAGGNVSGGGGGGAGAVGNDGAFYGGSSGSGGAGLQSSITGTALYYAGGGGGQGAAGGLGGGGGGTGTAYTGGGGSGSYAGGSGVVIISYISPYQLGSGGTVTSYTSGPNTVWVHKFTGSGTFIS